MQPRSEEFHAQECEGLAKRYARYEQLVRQWLFLAKQAEAERFNRRTLIVRVCPGSSRYTLGIATI